MTYSVSTLRWGIEQCFARNPTFAGVSPSHWARTSGHPEVTVQQIMDEVARARSTKVDPDVTDEEVQG